MCIQNPDGNLNTHSETMAEEFNNFLFSVGRELKITDIQTNPDSIFLNPVTNNELVEVINSLKNGASRGNDGISFYVVKQFHNYILVPLRHLW